MTIIAVDLSLTATGLAALSPGPHWDVASVTSAPTTNPDPTAGSLRRIEKIVDDIYGWITDRQPSTLFHTEDTGHGRLELCVLEAPAFSRNMGSSHERAGLWWMTYGMLHRLGAPVLVVLPNLRAKYATGKGNAGKDQVLLAVSRRYPDALVTTNNETDAVVLAAMGARWLGHPIDSLPKAHLDAMKTLRQ